eukprot:6492190-Amphidinium_carterae.2
MSDATLDRYFRENPCATSYVVDCVWPLQTPQPVRFATGCYGSAGLVVLPGPAKRMVFELIPEDSSRIAASVLRDGKIVGELLASMSLSVLEILCVRQPAIVAVLIAQQLWQEILILPTCYPGRSVPGCRLPAPHCKRYDLLCAGYPKHEWVLDVWQADVGKHSGTASDSTSMAPVTGDTLEFLKAFLRHCVNASEVPVLAHATSEDAIKFIHVVDQLAAPFRNALLANNRPQGMRYTAEQLLHAFLSTRHSGSLEQAAFAVEHVLNLMLPGIYQEVCANLPSATTLRSSRTRVDMALVRHAQLENKACRDEPRYRYGWSDSSPISGRDYFLSKHVSVPVHRAKLTYVACSLLALDTEEHIRAVLETSACMSDTAAPDMHTSDSTNAFLNDVEEADVDATTTHARAKRLSAEQRRELAFYIDDSLHFHVHVPCSVAYGHTGLEYKASCLTHQVAVECLTESDLTSWFDHIRSWTTDQGTEVGLAQYYVQAKKLLPPWWTWDTAGTSKRQFQADGEQSDSKSKLSRAQLRILDNPVALLHDGEDEETDEVPAASDLCHTVGVLDAADGEVEIDQVPA